MATRRIMTSQKTVLEKDNSTDFSPPAGPKSNINPAVPPYDSRSMSTIHMHRLANASHRHVIFKLLAFTLAMVIGPIGSYFLTLNIVFKGMAV